MPENLQEFYDRHKDFVYTYILCAFGGNVREAKRLTVLLFQEFFESVDKDPKQLKDSFLHSLLRRRTMSYAREHKTALTDMAPPSSYLTRLQSAIGSLPQLQRDCVLFKYIYGLTPRSLSKLLEKNEPSIRQNLSRGTKRIFRITGEKSMDSRSFRVPLAQLPPSVDQKLKPNFKTALSSVDLPFLEVFGQLLRQISAFISRKKLVTLGIVLLLVGGFGELPKLVYRQHFITPGNYLYGWKKNMEFKRLEKFRNPANLANFYLSLSNRRIQEASYLSKNPVLIGQIFPEALAQTQDMRHFPTITFKLDPVNAPTASLLAESGLMIQRAMEYAGNIDQPTTLINVLKNIKSTLEAQQGYLVEIQQNSSESDVAFVTRSLSLIHQLNFRMIEKAGHQAAEQALDAGTDIDPISPVPIQIIILQQPETDLSAVAESITIHQQFRPMIRDNAEPIRSFAEAVLELEEGTPLHMADSESIESLMQAIENLHFPQNARSSADKEEASEEPSALKLQETTKPKKRKKSKKIQEPKKTEALEKPEKPNDSEPESSSQNEAVEIQS